MIATGWGEAEAGMVADWHAGFRLPEIAARCGWSPPVVSRVLRQHGINPRGRPLMCGKSPSWTDAELVAVMFAQDEGDALRRYRARFPGSARTDNAVHRMFHEAKRQGESFHGWRRVQEGLI